MMHVAHVKSIEIDCTAEMSFLYRYRSVFGLGRPKKRFRSSRIFVVYLTRVTSAIKVNMLALQIDRDRILDDDIPY